MPTAEEGTCEVARPLISCLWRHTSLIRPRCTVSAARQPSKLRIACTRSRVYGKGENTDVVPFLLSQGTRNLRIANTAPRTSHRRTCNSSPKMPLLR